MRSPQSPLRLIPELRNYHVSFAQDYVPSERYYFERKYDLSTGELQGFRSTSTGSALRLVLSGRYSHLIIWEPLWVRMLPRHILLVLAWKIRSFGRRPVLSYAMENNDLRSLMVGNGKAPRWCVWVFSLVLGLYLRFAYTRLAFASEGSRDAYHRIPMVAGIESIVIPNLPAARGSNDEEKQPGRVVMVARMEARKGTDVLMRSWAAVEDALPDAQIVVIGDGPEGDRVAHWASERPGSRIYRGALPHADVMVEVSRSSVLVLPSVRDGRWREQIGLPVHEGLIHGLTIVTTDETGLAQKLANAGHHVVPVEDVDAQLSVALVSAVREPLDPVIVRSMLPSRDGRVAADHWLMGKGE